MDPTAEWTPERFDKRLDEVNKVIGEVQKTQRLQGTKIANLETVVKSNNTNLDRIAARIERRVFAMLAFAVALIELLGHLPR